MAERPGEESATDSRKGIASIFLLPDCNMACRFCASELDFAVMSWAQAEALLQRLWDRGVHNVVLGGGEPFLWPHDLLKLAARAKAIGFLVQVCTNATQLPDGFEGLPFIDRFVLPLEALEPTIHDRLRLLPGGHHAKVIATLDRLIAAQRSFTLSTVVTRTNLKQLPAMAAFLGDLRRTGALIHAWHLYRFLPVGRAGGPNADQLDTTLETFRSACKSIQELGLDFPVYRRSDMLKASSVAYFWADAEGLQTGG